MFGYSERLNGEYHKVYEESFRIKVATRFRWLIRSKLGGIFTAVAALVVIVILLEPAISGAISSDMFISLVNAIILQDHPIRKAKSRR